MNKSKVVILIGSSDFNLKTATTIIKSGVEVVGICVADKTQGGLNIAYLKIALKKYGLFKVIGQILERINYKIFNASKDEIIKHNLINTKEIHADIEKWGGDMIKSNDYNDSKTFDWIKSKSPDFILIQTPYWVGKKVREIPKVGIIGGHPGITPYYRGVHSPFWAVYNNESSKIGYTVFWVDKGVDTGDVIEQGKIAYDKTDSYISVSWKGMNDIAKGMSKAVLDYDSGLDIPRLKHKSIPDNSNYGHPTLANFYKYRRKKLLR